ncbi:yippee-like protein [Lichtheimia corymbifera JMRC:FSU:9682]|uniref:Protein yippee-like n=1 Tax=Lichtheimia corymbifera JMRC:FSU:9682 TaxID=1263082 RepID=A0A068RUW6_9FUNG|nr:yippee-like protein [Lichtheimia corymbifera JMRC:FSU:9682]
MGLKYRLFLEGNTIYGCINCKTHLSTSDAILSRQFQGQHGQAYLFDRVVNIIEGVAEEREMVTGIHTVKDISCIRCNTTLGWIYIRAHSAENKYKEGKCILERKLLVNNVC